MITKDSGQYIYMVLRVLHNYDQRLQSSFNVISSLQIYCVLFDECQKVKHDKEATHRTDSW